MKIINRTLLTTIIMVSTALTFALPIRNYDYYLTENGLSPQVAATGGINLTNPSFTNTSFYNPSLLAFREPSTVSISYRIYHEDETKLNDYDLPEETSLLWHRSAISYIGVEAQNFSFNYYSLSQLNFDEGEQNNDRNYINYYLDGYRISYGSESGQLAFGLNFSFLTGRAVYYRELGVENKPTEFIDDKAYGYGVDFGAVIKSNTLAYGLFIPNMLSRIHWSESSRQSMQRRFITGVQYGTDESFIVTGLSRKFDFKSSSTFHVGIQQNIDIGTIRGEYNTVPIRIGAYSEKPLWQLEYLRYGFGSGIRYGYFMLDLSINTTHKDWKNYYILGSISVSIDQ